MSLIQREGKFAIPGSTDDVQAFGNDRDIMPPARTSPKTHDTRRAAAHNSGWKHTQKRAHAATRTHTKMMTILLNSPSRNNWEDGDKEMDAGKGWGLK